MATYHGAELNFNEAELEASKPEQYGRYKALLDGMEAANDVESPDTDAMIADALTEEQIGDVLTEYTGILMKNSAYLFSNVFEGIAGGEGFSSNDFIKKLGDQMTGPLLALQRFEAGIDNTKTLDVYKDGGNVARVYGRLIVDEGVYAGADGIYVDGVKVVASENGTAVFPSGADIQGDVNIGGTLNIGGTVIGQGGITFGDETYWHSGNSNKEDVDWTMNNAFVNGALSVLGRLVANKGFELGNEDGSPLVYSSEVKEDGTYEREVLFNSDINIVGRHGVSIMGERVLGISDDKATVTLSVGNRVLKLGDESTQKITLSADIYDSLGAQALITKEGGGCFKKSFTAGANGIKTLNTYYFSSADYGIAVTKRIRISDSENGLDANTVSFRTDAGNRQMIATMPYLYNESGLPRTKNIDFIWKYRDTDNLFHIGSSNSATLDLDTDADYISFGKPTEAQSFLVKSDRFKTSLRENMLSFNEGAYLEGVGMTGLRLVSPFAMFTGNIGTERFSSGFSGYGWAVRSEQSGWWATFDNLTVRKKMRVFELEAQKISAVNGSLWVSHNCSADYVEAVN